MVALDESLPGAAHTEDRLRSDEMIWLTAAAFSAALRVAPTRWRVNPGFPHRTYVDTAALAAWRALPAANRLHGGATLKHNGWAEGLEDLTKWTRLLSGR
jgi:hypothetical protein